MPNNAEKDLPTAWYLKVAFSKDQQSEPVLEEAARCD
jgi:hypothetical protein